MGGVTFQVFSKLYNSTVWPVISYASSIWGTKSYSCINVVENRALRFFLGVGKFTPTAAVAGDTGWQPPSVKQLKAVGNIWSRMVNMSNDRVNKRVFSWARAHALSGSRNWVFHVLHSFAGMLHIQMISRFTFMTVFFAIGFLILMQLGMVIDLSAFGRRESSQDHLSETASFILSSLLEK